MNRNVIQLTPNFSLKYKLIKQLYNPAKNSYTLNLFQNLSIFYYNNDLTMYSAVENNTYIAVFDLVSEDVDLSKSSVTAGAMSAYGYRQCGVDNQIFFTYSPKNIVLYAAHNGEDITSNYK